MGTQESENTDAPFTLADLTVNICTVDRPEALRAALQSLVETTPPGPSLQLLLNEASPQTWPAVESLVEEWQGPVNVIRIDDRLPITASHQRALESVSTRLVNFMGDDDVVFGDRFTEAIEMFNSVENLRMLGTWAHRIGGDFDAPVRQGKMDVGPITLAEWESYRTNSTPVQYCFPGIIFHTEAAIQSGGFQDRFGSAMDAALSGYVAREWPSLTQTSRLFGFRIHEGSDSAKNFSAQYERYEYFEACLLSLDEGRPEPGFEQWQEQMADRPALQRFKNDRMIRSRHMFRRAGAALVDGRKGDFARFAALSFLAHPRQFFAKVKEQRGRPDR